MSTTRTKFLSFSACAIFLICAGNAFAITSGGGLDVPDAAEIDDAVCLAGCTEIRTSSPGGKVQVTIRKAGTVVGKRLVSVSKTCSFLAPVTLKKGTTGKLKVEVKFLGSRALKSTKRTSNLQVNG